jgi:hypothetical protein
VVCQAQLDDGVPTDKASLPRRHFFAHHSAVTAAEQMNQAILGNGFRTQSRGSIQRLALRRHDPAQSLQRFDKKSLGGGDQRLRHKSSLEKSEIR